MRDKKYQQLATTFKAELKTDGCNMIRCRCGNGICYVCKKSGVSYDHFHLKNTKNGCKLSTNAREDDLRAVEEAGLKAKAALLETTESEELKKNLEKVVVKNVGAKEAARQTTTPGFLAAAQGRVQALRQRLTWNQPVNGAIQQLTQQERLRRIQPRNARLQQRLLVEQQALNRANMAVTPNRNFQVGRGRNILDPVFDPRTQALRLMRDVLANENQRIQRAQAKQVRVMTGTQQQQRNQHTMGAQPATTMPAAAGAIGAIPRRRKRKRGYVSNLA